MIFAKDVVFPTHKAVTQHWLVTIHIKIIIIYQQNDHDRKFETVYFAIQYHKFDINIITSYLIKTCPQFFIIIFGL